LSGVRAEIIGRLIAGYPRSGNFTPNALLRAFEPVAADIRKRLGLLGLSPFSRLLDMNYFNPL
jgi:hypothetical protein